MINLASKNNCTGCSACQDVCPKDAISMRYDEFGFRYPIINTGKCIECRLCEKKCPALNIEDISAPYIKTFAGYSSETEDLLRTTSGGFATALSKLAIQKGYVVAGVKYTDDFIKAEYGLAYSENDLDAFRFSKYVQSEKNGIFKAIKTLLKDGQKVLFIGCPCDVAGLYYVIGNINHDNLLTCELVCMGVTSPKIASEFCSYIESKEKSKLTYLCARSKKNGWFVPTLEMKFENGKTKAEPLYASYYGRGFQIYNRPSCFNCTYRGTSGMGDIRIGDFWGIKKTDPYWNPNGVSCIFVRTKKGLSMVEKLRANGFRLYEVNYSEATDNNMSSTKNKGAKYEQLCSRFTQIFLEKGLVEACRETADFGFRIKRILPLGIQPFIKRVYHSFRDK